MLDHSTVTGILDSVSTMIVWSDYTFFFCSFGTYINGNGAGNYYALVDQDSWPPGRTYTTTWD